MICPPQRVKMMSIPSFLRPLATRWPPEILSADPSVLAARSAAAAMMALLIHRPRTGSSASQSQRRRVQSQDSDNGPDDPRTASDVDRSAAPMAMVGHVLPAKRRGATDRASE